MVVEACVSGEVGTVVVCVVIGFILAATNVGGIKMGENFRTRQGIKLNINDYVYTNKNEQRTHIQMGEHLHSL